MRGGDSGGGVALGDQPSHIDHDGDERDEEGDDLHDGNLTQETRTHNAP